MLVDRKHLVMRLVLTVSAMLLLLPVANSQDKVVKTDIPDDDNQKVALAVIADVYKSDYEKAKTPVQKVELAKKLLNVGTATNDDFISRFVLFRIARDIAAQQGDLATALDAVGRISQDFGVDQLQMQVDASKLAVKNMKTAKEHEASATILFPLIDTAITADRYDQAKILGELTLSCAKECRDAERIKQLVLKIKETGEIAAEFESVKKANDALKSDPTDPDANFAIGKFLCLVKGDWRRGGSMLALGSDERFKEVALLELEESVDSLKVGDLWWKIAETLNGRAKTQTQAHAAEWYHKALPGLSGLSKARVERQIEGIPIVKPASTNKEPPKKVAVTTNLPPIEGSWTAVSAEFSGSAPKSNFWNENKTLTISKSKFVLALADGVFEGTFEIDETATPKQITFHTNRKMTLLGIYMLDKEKNEMTTSWVIWQDGKDMPLRPVRFNTGRGEFKFTWRKNR